MRFLIPIAIVIVAGFAIDRAEQHGDTGFVHDKADQAFVQSAAGNLMAEAEWSDVAAQRAAAAPVKAFATRAAHRHDETLRELRRLASARSIPFPAGLEAEHLEERQRLDAASAPALDRAYVVAMIGLQQSSLALFEHEAAMGLDPELRTWAAERLPERRERLQQVRVLR